MTSNGAGQNPYEFILNPQTPQPSKFGGLKSINSKGMGFKIGLLVGGGVILLMIIVILVSIFTSGSSNEKANLISLAQTQQRLITIASDGTRNVRSQALANSAQTTHLSLLTQQKTYLDYLSANVGITIKEQELNQKGGTALTDELQEAVQATAYDEKYVELMNKGLADYTAELQTLYNSVTGPNLKKILETDFNQTQLLVTQLKIPDTVSAEATAE